MPTHRIKNSYAVCMLSSSHHRQLARPAGANSKSYIEFQVPSAGRDYWHSAPCPAFPTFTESTKRHALAASAVFLHVPTIRSPCCLPVFFLFLADLYGTGTCRIPPDKLPFNATMVRWEIFKPHEMIGGRFSTIQRDRIVQVKTTTAISRY